MEGWTVFDAGRFGSHRLPPRSKVLTPVGEVAALDSGGDGPSVVLVHGWGADSVLNWFSVYAPLVENGWRVVGVDVPGHGQSLPARKFTIATAADAVGETVSGLGIGSAVYAGYSLGGPITQELARRHPGQVDGLLPVATAAHIVPSSVNSALLGGGARLLGIAGGAADTVGRLVGVRSSSGHVVGHAFGALVGGSKRSFVQAGGELARFDSRHWVADLAVPATCVVTARDRVVPPAAQRELAELLGAECLEMDSGHTACLDGGFAAAMRWAADRLRVACQTGPGTVSGGSAVPQI